MSGVTAYFIEGPKHGDIDCLPEAHEVYEIAVTDAHRWTSMKDYGHYMGTSSFTVGGGQYRRGYELYGPPFERSRGRRAYLYIWQGVRP